MESFADLLQRARIRHRTKVSTDRWFSDCSPYKRNDCFLIGFSKEAAAENKAPTRERIFTKSRRRFSVFCNIFHFLGIFFIFWNFFHFLGIVSIFLEYFPFSWNLFHFFAIFSIFLEYFQFSNIFLICSIFPCFLEICNSVIIILSGKDKQKLELASSVYKRCKQIFQSIFMSGSIMRKF